MLKLTVHSILVNVPIHATQDQFDIRVEVRPHWSATVAFFTLVVDGAGGWLGWWADEPGGDKDCGGLLPPTGHRRRRRLPGVQRRRVPRLHGGGPEPTTATPACSACASGRSKGLSRFTATAFGIHELTGVPDRRRPRPLVRARGRHVVPAGVPLGYGIRLIGIGGIIGVDRRADTDALRERLTSGAVGNILFAEDPVRNAPILLGDLAALFPVEARLPRPRADGAARVDPAGRRLPGAARDRRDRRARQLPSSPTKAILLGSLNISVPGHEELPRREGRRDRRARLPAAHARDRRDDPPRHR